MTHPRTIAKAALGDDPEALREALSSEIPYGMPRSDVWRFVLREVAITLGHADPDASVEKVMAKWGRTAVSRESLAEIIQEMKGA